MAKTNLIILLILIYITITLSSYCGINPPEGPEYCANYLGNNDTHKCRYCTQSSTGKSYCLFVGDCNSNEYEGFNCNCNNYTENIDLPGASCANMTELYEKYENISAKDCFQYSKDESHPCCLYDDGINKTCVSIGKISTSTLYTYNNFLNCFSVYLNCKKFFLFLIVITILF